VATLDEAVAQDGATEKRVGRDGKSYPAAKAEFEASWKQWKAWAKLEEVG
jgi:hypothetical protein